MTGSPIAIDDPADERLAAYRNLTDPALRRQVEADQAVMVVEGRVAVRQLLGSGHRVRSLLVDDHQAVLAGDLVEDVLDRDAPVYVGRRDVVEATVGFALHRGVVAVAQRPPASDVTRLLAAAMGSRGIGGGPPLVAVLEGLNDHENIGALFRNAAAFGVAAVLLDPSCADPLSRRSIRVSAGHALRVPFGRLNPWPGALDLLRTAGLAVVALAPRADRSPNHGRAPLTLPELGPALAHRRGGRGSPPTGVALVLGAEGPGLSAGLLSSADEVVSIPMAPGVDSLNVATAAAIAFHHLSVT
jgi:tRNA G18 (ribose-2'-O)-methylase SpoU